MFPENDCETTYLVSFTNSNRNIISKDNLLLCTFATSKFGQEIYFILSLLCIIPVALFYVLSTGWFHKTMCPTGITLTCSTLRQIITESEYDLGHQCFVYYQ